MGSSTELISDEMVVVTALMLPRIVLALEDGPKNMSLNYELTLT